MHGEQPFSALCLACGEHSVCVIVHLGVLIVMLLNQKPGLAQHEESWVILRHSQR
jgi:ABC-type nitrate/sulfonate/bicarbonate transport system permease component